MKIIARAFAITLVLAGFAATCHTQPHQTRHSIQGGLVPTDMPVPVCPPNDPNACGIDKL